MNIYLSSWVTSPDMHRLTQHGTNFPRQKLKRSLTILSYDLISHTDCMTIKGVNSKTDSSVKFNSSVGLHGPEPQPATPRVMGR